MGILGSIISGGASLIGGFLGYQGAEESAEAYGEAAQEAIDFQRQAYEEQQGYLQPYRDMGSYVLNMLFGTDFAPSVATTQASGPTGSTSPLTIEEQQAIGIDTRPGQPFTVGNKQYKEVNGQLVVYEPPSPAAADLGYEGRWKVVSPELAQLVYKEAGIQPGGQTTTTSAPTATTPTSSDQLFGIGPGGETVIPQPVTPQPTTPGVPAPDGGLLANYPELAPYPGMDYPQLAAYPTLPAPPTTAEGYPQSPASPVAGAYPTMPGMPQFQYNQLAGGETAAPGGGMTADVTPDMRANLLAGGGATGAIDPTTGRPIQPELGQRPEPAFTVGDKKYQEIDGQLFRFIPEGEEGVGAGYGNKWEPVSAEDAQSVYEQAGIAPGSGTTTIGGSGNINRSAPTTPQTIGTNQNVPLIDLSGQTFEASPGYQFQLDEARNAIEKMAAARGLNLSSNTIENYMKTAQGLASQDYYNWINYQFQKADFALDAWQAGRAAEIQDWVLPHEMSVSDWQRAREANIEDWQNMSEAELRDWINTRSSELEQWAGERGTALEDWQNQRNALIEDWRNQITAASGSWMDKANVLQNLLNLGYGAAAGTAAQTGQTASNVSNLLTGAGVMESDKYINQANALSQALSSGINNALIAYNTPNPGTQTNYQWQAPGFNFPSYNEGGLSTDWTPPKYGF